MATRRAFRFAPAVALVAIAWPSAALATLIVNDPQPITRRVTVQLIQTALDDGTSPATVFGNAAQRADIEAAVDTIWAQAGIDVAFLADVVRYNDTFAYQGNSGTAKRPTNDLSIIRLNAAAAGGILHPDPLVINMFMVNVVPGFAPLSESHVAGLARLDANGIAAYVGDNLLNSANNRDVAASVIAHEIGHNLGLFHTADDQPNLMSPGGDTEQLTASQINTARASSLARVIEFVLPGDYNRDDVVDAGDYVVWRNSLGQTGLDLPADGDHNGRVDAEDYSIWRTNYGRGPGTGGIAAPEPAPWSLLLAALLIRQATPSRRRRPKSTPHQ